MMPRFEKSMLDTLRVLTRKSKSTELDSSTKARIRKSQEISPVSPMQLNPQVALSC